MRENDLGPLLLSGRHVKQLGQCTIVCVAQDATAGHPVGLWMVKITCHHWPIQWNQLLMKYLSLIGRKIDSLMNATMCLVISTAGLVHLCSSSDHVKTRVATGDWIRYCTEKR